MKEPSSHIVIGGSLLCGSRSIAAMWRSVTCSRCESRAEKMMEALINVAEGKAGAAEAAKALVKKLGYVRADVAPAVAAADGAMA